MQTLAWQNLKFESVHPSETSCAAGSSSASVHFEPLWNYKRAKMYRNSIFAKRRAESLIRRLYSNSRHVSNYRLNARNSEPPKVGNAGFCLQPHTFNLFGISFYKNAIIRFYSTDFPSHHRISLPALSPTMEMGTIISWEKKEGDKLNEGDILAEIETDKATMGFETPEEGYLAKILLQAGSKDVPLGKLLCIIVENEEDIAAFKDFEDSGESAPSPSIEPSISIPTPSSKLPEISPEPPAVSEPTPSIQQTVPGSRILASPLARKLASEKGIDLSTLQGTGPSGRIRAQDIENATVATPEVPVKMPASIPQPTPGTTFIDVPISALKQEAARQSSLSKQTIPHYYLTVDIVADELISLKEKLNLSLSNEDDMELTITDFIIKASAIVCRKIPEANSSWQTTFIRQFNTIDINVVMSCGNNESVSPIIHSVEKKGLVSISSEIKQNLLKIKEGVLQNQPSQVGTFTVSSLGMFGVKNVINAVTPSQSCSLGVGSILERLVPDADSETGYKTASVLSVTLSCDHRVIDGAVGAQWLKNFKNLLEKPHTMLL